MILRCLATKNADDERELRVYLANELGRADAESVAQLFWEHRRGSESPYVGDLAALCREVHAKGKGIAGLLIEVAAKPKEQREFEMDVRMWVAERLPKTVATIRAHRGAPEAAAAEYDAFLFDFEAWLQRMHPKHRATMKGAIASSIVHRDGAISIDFATMTKVLFMADPLAATAAQSRRC